MFRWPSERGVVCRLSGSNQTKWKIRSLAQRQPLRAADQSAAGSTPGLSESPQIFEPFFFFLPFFAGALCGTSFPAAASFRFHKAEPRPTRTKRQLGDMSLCGSEKHQKRGSDTRLSDAITGFQHSGFVSAPRTLQWAHGPHRTSLTPRCDQTSHTSGV